MELVWHIQSKCSFCRLFCITQIVLHCTEPSIVPHWPFSALPSVIELDTSIQCIQVLSTALYIFGRSWGTAKLCRTGTEIYCQPCTVANCALCAFCILVLTTTGEMTSCLRQLRKNVVQRSFESCVNLWRIHISWFYIEYCCLPVCV